MDFINDPIGRGAVIAEYSSGSLVANYSQGNGLVSRKDSNYTSFFTFDAVGNTSELIDSPTIIQNSYVFTPFGSALSTVTTLENPFGFGGSFGTISLPGGSLLSGQSAYLPDFGRFASPPVLGGGGNVSFPINNPITMPIPINPIKWFPPPGGPVVGQCPGGTIPDPVTGECEDPDHHHHDPDPPEPCPPRFHYDECGRCVPDDTPPSPRPCKDQAPPPPPSPTPPDPCTIHPEDCMCYAVSPMCTPTPPSAPQDPNSLVGPMGYGTPNFVAGNSLLSYTVGFQNASNASAPAQIMIISEQLTNTLDLSTLQLAELDFGNYFFSIPAGSQHYANTLHLTQNGFNYDLQIDAGLNPATGLLQATFKSVNPTNGLPPPVTVGFLQPETSPSTGVGTGHISYTIRPNPGLATGAQIRSVATVQFDQNPAIATDLVDENNPSSGHDTNKQALVTIDATPPTSAVASLPAVATNAAFTVCWSGSDVGAGVVGYDIYVQTNGGSWNQWLTGTPLTCATFYGQDGNTYGFYSIAHDGAGNVESKGTVAEATTMTLSNYPPVMAPVSNAFIVVGQQLVVTNQAYDPNTPIIFSLGSGAPAGAMITTNGIFRWTPSCAQGSTTNTITIWATDSGTPPESSSVTFTVKVPECIQAGLGSTVMQVGQTSSVPVVLLSTVALTNMSFTVPFPPDRLTNFALLVNSPQVLTQQLQVSGMSNLLVSFILTTSSVLHGPTNVGQLSFAALSSQSSGFIPLALSNVAGLKPDGGPVGNAFGQPGRVVVVGKEPLLEAALATNAQRVLTLYGNPGSSYLVSDKTNLLGTNWLTGWRVPLTNLAETFGLDAASAMIFYRAAEFFADPPIVELVPGGTNNLTLLLYGKSGTNYVLQLTTNLAANAWFPATNFMLTNSFLFINEGSKTNKALFYRGQRQ